MPQLATLRVSAVWGLPELLADLGVKHLGKAFGQAVRQCFQQDVVIIVDRRPEALEMRLDAVDADGEGAVADRLEALAGRLEQVTSKLDTMTDRLDKVEDDFATRISELEDAKAFLAGSGLDNCFSRFGASRSPGARRKISSRSGCFRICAKLR